MKLVDMNYKVSERSAREGTTSKQRLRRDLLARTIDRESERGIPSYYFSFYGYDYEIPSMAEGEGKLMREKILV